MMYSVADDIKIGNPAAASTVNDGVINFTKDHYLYNMLENDDKMNYAFHIMNYNVFEKAEVAQGASEMRQVKKVQDLFKLDSPKKVLTRTVNIASFVSALLLIIIFVAWIGCFVVGASEAKKSILGKVLLLMIGLVIVSYVLEWVKEKAMDKIDDVKMAVDKPS